MNKDFSPTPGQWEQGPEQYYDVPPPEVEFYRSSFVLTGIFALGERPAVEKAIVDLGGKVSHKPPKSGCYVVVGTLPSKQWIRSDAGRKLLTAIELRNQGRSIAIISEDYFVEALIEAQKKPQKQLPILPSQCIDWNELLAAWFAPLKKDLPVPFYEFYLTKAMVIVHRPGNPKPRLCMVRFHEYGPTSIDVPEILTAMLPWCWEHGEGQFDAVAEKKLPRYIIAALAERLNMVCDDSYFINQFTILHK